MIKCEQIINIRYVINKPLTNVCDYGIIITTNKTFVNYTALFFTQYQGGKAYESKTRRNLPCELTR